MKSLLLIACFLPLLTLPARGQYPCSPVERSGYTGVGSISLQTTANIGPQTIGNAESYWTDACGQSGSIPFFSVNNNYADLQIPVYYHFEPGDVACGATYTYTYSQMPVFIDLYQSAPNANGQIVACNPTDSLAHEIGHVLGLGHTSSDACVGEIMGRAIDGQPRSVMSGDCATADQNWYTPEEYDQDHINDSCYQECRGSCDQGVCTDSTPSPILIDLAGNGYHLTGLAGGVHFDLDADAEAEATSWTRDGSNAFLCLDRNGNGIIENGQELFGNYTVLSNGSRAQNGYEALAEYDQPALGGNGDGWIDPDDAIWPFLRVWADDNHDGISQSHELSSLDAAGIVRIDTHYFTSRRRDQYGNQFRYRGRCVIRGKGGAEREHTTYDVFFATRDSPH